jgi:hypothetical protein
MQVGRYTKYSLSDAQVETTAVSEFRQHNLRQKKWDPYVTGEGRKTLSCL